MTGFEKNYQWLNQRGIRPGQDVAEIKWLCQKVQDKRCNSMIEIGSRNGGSLYLLGMSCEPGAVIVSIDKEGISWGKRNSAQSLALVLAELQLKGYRTHYFPGISSDPDIMEKVRRVIKDDADLLFIDADHRFEHVVNDWFNYKGMVHDGGMIAFHDICHDERDQRWGMKGVDRLWKTLKAKHKTEEITLFPGIGVLYKGVAC